MLSEEEDLPTEHWVMYVTPTWEDRADKPIRIMILIQDLDEASLLGSRMLKAALVRKFYIGKEELKGPMLRSEQELARQIRDALNWREHLVEITVASSPLFSGADGPGAIA